MSALVLLARAIPVVAVALVMLGGHARAAEGALPLSTVCALAGTCLPGDAPGFPITIASSGSYRLAEDLVVATPDESAVSIQASSVAIDLAGFSIRGPTAALGATCATGVGSGIGVQSTATATGVSLRNGWVSGFGAHGIVLRGPASRIDRVNADHNCGDGITVGPASLVVRTQALDNGGRGIVADRSSLLRAVSSSENVGRAVEAGNGFVLIEALEATEDDLLSFGVAGGGVVAGPGSMLRESAIATREMPAIQMGTDSLLSDVTQQSKWGNGDVLTASGVAGIKATAIGYRGAVPAQYPGFVPIGCVLLAGTGILPGFTVCP